MSGSGAVIAKMYSWATLKRAGCEGQALTTGTNMQNYARLKSEKLWKQHTGDATGHLKGGMYWQSIDELMIYIAHGMDYGVYLELAHDRKYQILEETVNKFKDRFYNAVKKIMES